jgi:hypothetical protein
MNICKGKILYEFPHLMAREWDRNSNVFEEIVCPSRGFWVREIATADVKFGILTMHIVTQERIQWRLVRAWAGLGKRLREGIHTTSYVDLDVGLWLNIK